MFYFDAVNYPNMAYVALLVKRAEGVWETLYKSDTYWLDIQQDLGSAKISEYLIPHFNENIRLELGLPELGFNEQVNEYLTGSTKVVGNMLVFVK